MKKFNLILCFCFLFFSVFAEKEIPHEIIKENPRKAVKQIKTLLRRDEPAKLTIKVKKIKTKKLDVEIDESRKILSFSPNENFIKEKTIFLGEEEMNLLNNSGFSRKIVNKGRSLLNKNFEVISWENRKPKKISYKNLGSELYIATLNEDYEIENIYSTRLLRRERQENARSTIKIWLFGKDLDKMTNLIITPSQNGNGNFLIRANSSDVSPEYATERLGTYSTFDINGNFLNENFDDTDIITIQNSWGAYNIKNNQGSFYENRNKYASLTFSGYNVKARIWSEFEGVELSLEKMGGGDGVSKFTLLHQTKEGVTLQTIDFEIYINNKEIDEYFVKKKNSDQFPVDDIYMYLNNHIPINTDISVNDFVSDKIGIKSSNSYNIEQRWGENGNIHTFSSNIPIKFEGVGNLNGDASKRVNYNIISASLYIQRHWYDDNTNTAQFFTADGLNIIYGNGKRKINIPIRVGIFSYWLESIEKISGKLVGLPLLNTPLNKENINGIPTIKFLTAHSEYRVVEHYPAINASIVVNNRNLFSDYNFQDGITFNGNGVEYSLKYDFFDNPYNMFLICIKKLDLLDRDREENIVAYTNINYEQVVSKQNIIKIPKFEPEILINKYNSSISKNIFRYEEVNNEILTYNNGKLISLGKVFFYQLNTEILRQNSNENPKIYLGRDFQLIPENSDSAEKIDVELSFDKYTSKNTIEMDINRATSAGEGGEIFLKISPNEYSKFIKNGSGITYKLKSRDNVICNVSFRKTHSPTYTYGGNINFINSLIDSVTIKTKEVTPSIGKIEFLPDTPLLKDKTLAMKNNFIYYMEPARGYDYNKTVELIGDVLPYDFNQKKHNVEIVDGNGRIIDKIIGTNAYAGYWQDIPINGNILMGIGYRKNDDRTFLALKKWNFEETESSIIIKHYDGSKDSIKQYYIFQIKLPKFNPLIYYDEGKTSSTIKINDELNIPLSKDKEIFLGDIGLRDYDWEITKINDGNLKDEIGLRITGNNNVKIVGENGRIYTGKIIIKDSNNQNISYFNRKRESAKVYLKLDSDIAEDGNYTIDGDDQNYILQIGRNKYFKNIIKRITLKADRVLQGGSTLKINGNYILGNKIKFNSTTLDKRNLSTTLIQKPRGIELLDIVGSAPLKMEKNDRIKIIFEGNPVVDEIIGDNGNLAEKVLTSSDGEIYFSVVGGNMEFNFKKKQIFTHKKGELEIEIIRNNIKTGIYRLLIINEPSWIIIDEKQDLDFGKGFAGEKNKKAHGFINFRTSSDVAKDNIKVSLEDRNPKLYKNTKELQSSIEKASLNEKGKNNYHFDVDGRLDIPINTEIGNYKGEFEVTIEVKE